MDDQNLLANDKEPKEMPGGMDGYKAENINDNTDVQNSNKPNLETEARYQDNTARFRNYSVEEYGLRMEDKPRGANGFSYTGLVLGIISLLMCCIPVFDLVLGVAGLALSIFGQKKSGSSVGIAGIIVSAIGSVLGAFSTFIILISIFA